METVDTTECTEKERLDAYREATLEMYRRWRKWLPASSGRNIQPLSDCDEWRKLTMELRGRIFFLASLAEIGIPDKHLEEILTFHTESA